MESDRALEMIRRPLLWFIIALYIFSGLLIYVMVKVIERIR